MDFVSKYVIFGRNDRMCFVDTASGMRTCICFANQFRIDTPKKKEKNARVVFSFWVGMKHSPTAKQDSVCGSKHRRLESDLKGKRRLIAVRQTFLDEE